jgi:hypothetical protein
MSMKFKYPLIGLVVVFVALTAGWKVFGASMTGTTKQFLLQTASNSINGTLSVGDVEFALPGALIANQVEVKDKSGALIASARTLALDLDLSELLSRSIDIGRIKKIRLEGLVLHFSRDKEHRWNATEALPHSTTAVPAVFRGLVILSNATVAVVMPDNRYDFKNVDGSIDCAKYPDIGLDLKAKSDASALTAKGTWNFSGGGKVEVTADKIDPTAYSPNIPLKGVLTTKFVLTGTTDIPTAKGLFQIPVGSLNELAFTDATGDFSYSGSILSLSNVRMNAFGGSLSTSGPLQLDTLRYTQTISGQNIDSAQLSEKDIQGRINFTAEAQGQGAQSSNADGTFQMGSGSMSGVAFEALTGTFAKRGGNTRYYNLRVTIAGQTIYIGEADSLTSIKIPLLNLALPNSLPIAPKTPQFPVVPKNPVLPKIF